MERSIENLPPEVGEQAIRFIPLKDLCSVVLTSTYMRTVASNSNLWSGMRVKKEKIHLDGLTQLFSINRFRKIRKIDLSWMTFNTEELQWNLDAISSSSVEDLNLKCVDLSEIPAELLARTAGHLNKIILDYTTLTTEQCVAVLETCISSPTLVDVSLQSFHLEEVPAELLGRAAGHLHKINLAYTNLMTVQCKSILETCISSSTLFEVSLMYANLGEIAAELLAGAVGHLHKINLDYTNLTTEQCIAILESCLSSSTLVDVSLEEVNLQEISAELLARAASHLNKIYLYGTNTEQSLALLESCISSSTLVNVSLVNTDLKDIPAQLVARAASHLQKINFNIADLTTEQSIALLESCVSSSTLVNVSLMDVDLKDVPAELLARAASHLKKINLDRQDTTNITNEQCLAVLESCISSTTLVKMTLSSDFLIEAEMPADLLARARNMGRLCEE